MRGLLQSEEEFEHTLKEILETKCSTAKMCEFFALMLIWHDVGDARSIWENCWEKLGDTFLRKKPHGDELPPPIAHNKVLDLVALTLDFYGISPSNYGLEKQATDCDRLCAALPVVNLRKEIDQESGYDLADQSQKLESMPPCTAEQQQVLDDLFLCIDGSDDYQGPHIFYVNGPAGAGKTFLYTKALRRVRSTDRIAVAVAMSGIAALLLEGGRTAHSRFKLPVPLPLANASSSISARSSLANLYRNADLIVWDEAPNAPKSAFEAVDKLLRDILADCPRRSSQKAFGGMPMLLGGDFRQIPPVLRRIDSEAFPAHTLKACAFWSDRQATRTYQLTENKRAEQDPWYAAFVLSVGDGTHLRDAATDAVDGLHPAAVSVPSCLAAPDDSSVEDLVAWTYPDFASIIDLPLQDQLEYFGERVIVTPTNAAANALNEYILSLMPGLCKTYTSYDSIIEGDASAEHYPPEFLHTLDSSGMPPHTLHLQIGALLIVLRNYAPHLGLCNGTRVLMVDAKQRTLKVVILTGTHRGDICTLPRIVCDSSGDTDLPFAFRRYQFPVRLAWVMTINKSQGQGFTARVGLHLPRPVFAHGQLYVALSRAVCAKNVRVFMETHESEQMRVSISGTTHYLTLNVVNRAYLNDECFTRKSVPIATSPAPCKTKGKWARDVPTFAKRNANNPALQDTGCVSQSSSPVPTCPTSRQPPGSVPRARANLTFKPNKALELDAQASLPSSTQNWARDANNCAIPIQQSCGRAPPVSSSFYEESESVELAPVDARALLSFEDGICHEVIDEDDVETPAQIDLMSEMIEGDSLEVSCEWIPELPAEARRLAKAGDARINIH